MSRKQTYTSGLDEVPGLSSRVGGAPTAMTRLDGALAACGHCGVVGPVAVVREATICAGCVDDALAAFDFADMGTLRALLKRDHGLNPEEV